MPSRPEQQWQFPEPPVTLHTTAQEYAYERLRYAIMVGGVPPGAALTIRGVSSALELSPTPVRESLKRLCAEGALLSQSNRRIITPPVTAARHRELINTRVALEQFALKQAFAYVTEKDIETLTAIDLRMDRTIVEQDYIQLVNLNQQFHSLLYTRNPEQICMPMIESVWLQLGPHNRTAAERAGEITAEDWHKYLIDALRKRDAGAAAQALASDIRDGSAFHLQPKREIVSS